MSETRIILKCSKCGRFLGVYVGEPFYLIAENLGKVKILCNKCFKGGEKLKL